MNLADELARRLKRRGMAVPAKPYAPIQAPYRRPEPLNPEAPKRVKLTDADRAAIREMKDAGVSWEEIEEQFGQTRDQMQNMLYRRLPERRTRCSRCDAPMQSRKPEGSVVVCGRCVGPHRVSLDCRACGVPAPAGQELCVECRRAKERADALNRARRNREEAKG